MKADLNKAAQSPQKSSPNKSVGVVCSTYRNPDNTSLVRLYGVVSLLDQMRNQNYDGDIRLALVDDSAEPHPFYEQIAKAFPDTVIYLHATDRKDMIEKLDQDYPESARFVPSDKVLVEAVKRNMAERVAAGKPVYAPELKLARGDFNLSKDEWDGIIGKEGADIVSKAQASFAARSSAEPLSAKEQEAVNFWQDRLKQMRAYAKFVPFERSYPIQTNIYSQLFGERPTIGMKKNIGIQALAETFGKFDVVLFADDDDHHSPDYAAEVVKALGENDFTRMTRYVTHIFTPEVEKRKEGIFELKIEKDEVGYWVLPSAEESRTMKLWHPEGYAMEKEIGDKFSRPVTMAWPILSHEGALHTYSFKSWERSVEKFGGAAPVSFCEDIIHFRMNKDYIGKDFKDVLTPVEPGKEHFVRMADGGNASVIEWMDDLKSGEAPEWTRDALRLLYAAEKLPKEAHITALTELGKAYAKTGELDYSAIDKLTPGAPKKGPDYQGPKI